MCSGSRCRIRRVMGRIVRKEGKRPAARGFTPETRPAADAAPRRPLPARQGWRALINGGVPTDALPKRHTNDSKATLRRDLRSRTRRWAFQSKTPRAWRPSSGKLCCRLGESRTPAYLSGAVPAELAAVKSGPSCPVPFRRNRRDRCATGPGLRLPPPRLERLDHPVECALGVRQQVGRRVVSRPRVCLPSPATIREVYSQLLRHLATLAGSPMGHPRGLAVSLAAPDRARRGPRLLSAGRVRLGSNGINPAPCSWLNAL